MKNILEFTMIMAAAILITACATIFSKSNYPVKITSSPEGADIKITNGKGVVIATGRTPTTINLDAGAGFFEGQNYTVTLIKNGYTEHKMQISRGVDAWYIVGNFFIPINWIVGYLIVDPITGAMWTLDDAHAELNVASGSGQRESVRILTYDEVPVEKRERLIRIR